jgi:hypothetical protein
VEVFEPVKGDMEELRAAREDVVAMVVEIFTMLISCVWLTDTEGSRNGWLPNL